MKMVVNFLGGLVMLSAVSACSGNVSVKFGEDSVSKPVGVRVLTVEKSPVHSGYCYVGRVEPSRSTLVLAPFPGTVEEVNVSEGRRVSEGAVVARLGSGAVKSAYDIAKATLEQAEDGYARAQIVYESGGMTEVKMVEIRTQLEKARAAEKSAGEAVADCEMTAPFSGVVDEVLVHRGEKVVAAAPVVRILDLGSVEIHFSVPENEYSRIAAGSVADVEVPALGKSVTGHVAVKGVTASALSHSYDFTLKGISDARGLTPGMVCKVRISREGVEDIVIPASSVMTDREGRYVWALLDDDTVCRKRVVTGGYSGKGVVIVSGLDAGDRVIVEGSRKVSTGMKVKAEEK